MQESDSSQTKRFSDNQLLRQAGLLEKRLTSSQMSSELVGQVFQEASSLSGFGRVLPTIMKEYENRID